MFNNKPRQIRKGRTGPRDLIQSRVSRLLTGTRMLSRDPINTASLQKKFPEVYRDFFLNHDLVVSTNTDVPILHDNNSRFRGVAIKQKIDSRIYVGISVNSAEGSTFTSYDCREQRFRSSDANNIFHALPESIANLCQSLHLSPAPKFNVDILSESSQGYGMGLSSKLAVLIPLIVSLYYAPDNIAGETPIEDRIKRAEFRKIIQPLVYSFLVSLRRNDIDVSGMGGFHSGATPDFYLYPKGTVRTSALTLMEKIEMGSLGQEQKTPGTPPYDYYLLYTGKKSPVHDIQYAHEQDKQKIDAVLQNLPVSLPGGGKKRGLTASLYEDYQELLYNISFAFWNELSAFLNHPVSSDLFRIAVERLDQYALLKQYLETGGEETKHLLQEIRGRFTARGVKNYAVVRNGSFQTGGSISIFTERERGRELIQSALEELQCTHPYLETIFVSHLDGFGGTGLLIDKWIQRSIRSTFDSPTVQIVEDGAGNKTYHKTVHPENLTYDLVLDTIQNKIFISQKPVSYKELHSQRMTIDILKILVAHGRREVNNDELPSSSYAENKNEIISKIIAPLTRLVEKRTGKKLQLLCQGSITNFSLKLLPGEVNIALISAK